MVLKGDYMKSLNYFYTRFLDILRDNKGSGSPETIAKVLVTPVGYKYLSKGLELYSVQLGMLNRLLVSKMVTDKEHRQMKSYLKQKYKIK